MRLPTLGTAVATTLTVASACLALIVLVLALAATVGGDEAGNEREGCRPGSRWRSFSLHATSVRLFLSLSALAGVVDTLVRWYDLGAFYTSDGVFPARVYDFVCANLGVCDFDFDGSEVLTRMDHSVHLMSGHFGVQCLLFGLTVIVGVCSAWQPNPRRAAAMYFLVSSMHRRNHWINNKGSETLRAMLLWSILLSLEIPRRQSRKQRETGLAAPSQDGEKLAETTPATTAAAAAAAAAGATEPSGNEGSISHITTTPAGVGYIFQVSILYWFSAMYKYADREQNAWVDGSALRRALGMTMYRNDVGGFILSLPPTVAETLTYGAGILECAGPFLLFSPVMPTSLRNFAVALFVGFHAGIGCSMRLGVFPVYSCLVFVPLAPGHWWPKWVLRAVTSPSTRAPPARPYPASSPTATSISRSRIGLSALSTRVYSKCARTWHHGATAIITLLLFWWQIHHYDRVVVPMPRIAKEACAVLGLKQHWKVFTSLYELEPNCIPFIVGAVDGSDRFLHRHRAGSWASETQQQAVPEGGLQFVDLIKWHNAGGPFRPGLISGGPAAVAAAEAQLLHAVGAPSEETLMASELTPEKVLSKSSSTLASTYLWRQWAAVSLSIDMNVIGTGQFFCKQWNHMRILSLTVQVDDQNVTLTFTPRPEDVLRASKSFCVENDISMEQCQRLYDMAEHTAARQRLEAYSFFNVCMRDSLTFAGSTVTGQTRRCDDAALTNGQVHRVKAKIL